MAPIPNTIPEDALFLISAAERRYNYLTDSELPKLRQCIGPLSVQQTLAEDLRVDTIALTRQVEVSLFETIFRFSHDPSDRIQALEIMIDDLQGEKNRRELRGIVDDFNKKLARCGLFYPFLTQVYPFMIIKIKFATRDPSCFASLKTSY